MTAAKMADSATPQVIRTTLPTQWPPSKTLLAIGIAWACRWVSLIDQKFSAPLFHFQMRSGARGWCAGLVPAFSRGHPDIGRDGASSAQVFLVGPASCACERFRLVSKLT